MTESIAPYVSQENKAPAMILSRKRRVLIALPREWFVEECCVQPNPDATPCGALLLAALLRSRGHMPQVITIIPKKGFFLNLSDPPDVMVIYCGFNQVTAFAGPLASQIKKLVPKIITVLVLYDSLANCEEQALVAYPSLDYAVLPNEKEMAVADIIDYGEPTCTGGFGTHSGIITRDNQGAMISTGQRPALPTLDHLPYMGQELDLFWRNNECSQYIAGSVVVQRGCPNACIFCPMHGTRPRFRDPDIAASEINVANSLTGGAYLLSLEVLQNPTWLEELCSKVITNGTYMGSGIGTRCDYVENPDLLALLRRAGVKYMYFGIEAGTEEMRSRLRKPISDHQIESAVRLASQAGLEFIAAFITGLPWEDIDYYNKLAEITYHLARHSKCKRINLSRLQPWPGLPITKQMIKENILTRDFTLLEWNQKPREIMNQFRHTKYLRFEEVENASLLISNAVKNIISSKITGVRAP